MEYGNGMEVQIKIDMKNLGQDDPSGSRDIHAGHTMIQVDSVPAITTRILTNWEPQLNERVEDLFNLSFC